MLILATPPIKSLALARLDGAIAISTVAGFTDLELSPLVRGYLENRIARSSATGTFVTLSLIDTVLWGYRSFGILAERKKCRQQTL